MTLLATDQPLRIARSLPRLNSPTRIVGLVLLVAAIGFGAGSLSLGLWAYGMPGIGLSPLLASIGILPISLLILLDPGQAAGEEPFQVVPVVGGLGFALYGVSLAYLGLVLPTFLFIVAWARLLYRRPWKVSLGAAFGITTGLYILFVRFLGVPMQIWPI